MHQYRGLHSGEAIVVYTAPGQDIEMVGGLSRGIHNDAMLAVN